MDYDNQFKEREVTEFNEMSFKIQRLHNLWLGITNTRENGGFEKCRWKLDSAEAELNYETERLDTSDGTKYINILQEINEQIDVAFVTRKIRDVYKLLMKKEMLLRKIQQEAGMGTRYRSMDDNDMD